MPTTLDTATGLSGTAAAAPTRRGEVQPFDFRTPNKLSRDHVRALQLVHEAFARQSATIFATSLRSSAHVSVTSIGQIAWGEFAAGVPDPSYLGVLSVEPLPGPAIFHFPLSLVMSFIDLLLGGSGRGPLPERPPTEIESGLIRDLMDKLLAELARAFEPLFPITARVSRQESTIQFVPMAAPSDPTVIVTYEITLGETVGTAALCMPVGTLQPVLDAAGTMANNDAGGRTVGDTVKELVRLRLLDVPIGVRVTFPPVSLTSADILGLTVGDVLPLHHPEHAPLELRAEGAPFLSVRPGRRGKKMACVVVETDLEDS